MLIGLGIAIVLCIVALVLLLPKSHSTTKTSISPGNYSNFTYNTSTSIKPTTSVTTTTRFATTYVSTVTIPNNYSGYNYSYYVNQSLAQYNITTTIPYVYCVGSAVTPGNLAYYAPINSTQAGPWNLTTSYPLNLNGGSCSIFDGTIYCVGGGTSSLPSEHYTRAFYASLQSYGGIGTWMNTTNYPIPFSGGSCSAYNNYIYCVGSFNKSTANYVFYASLTKSGIGSWIKTTNYPVPFFQANCNAYNGYIYCIGDQYFNISSVIAQAAAKGANETIGQPIPQLNSSYAYYAPISSSGVGNWSQIQGVPLSLDGGSCTISDFTIYCVGGTPSILPAGLLNLSNNSNFTNLVNNQYFVDIMNGTDAAAKANLTSRLNAILESESQLSATSNYSGSFYAPIQDSGAVGNWQQSNPYLSKFYLGSCVSQNGYIYCIGGGTSPSNVSYANISPYTGISSWNTTLDYPTRFLGDSCSVAGSIQ